MRKASNVDIFYVSSERNSSNAWHQSISPNLGGELGLSVDRGVCVARKNEPYFLTVESLPNKSLK